MTTSITQNNLLAAAMTSQNKYISFSMALLRLPMHVFVQGSFHTKPKFSDRVFEALNIETFLLDSLKIN